MATKYEFRVEYFITFIAMSKPHFTALCTP